MKTKLLLALTALLALGDIARAQVTAFTYQGRLNDGANPATGVYDFSSLFYTNATAGTPLVGPPTFNPGVGVTNGLFTMQIAPTLPNLFTGQSLWLELSVRTNGSGSYTNLAPRQKFTPTPYAIYATSAGSASNVTGSVADSQLSPNIPRLNSAPTFSGSVTAVSFYGSGFGLTGLNAAQLTSGTVPDGQLSTNVALLNASQTFAASNTFNGVVRATNAANQLVGTFTGNGAGLTNLPVSSGPANVAVLSSNQTFTASNTFAGVITATNAANQFVGTFTGNGAGLTNLNATQLTSGTIPLAQLPAAVVTNGASGVNISGTFAGNGAGVTNVNATGLGGLSNSNLWQTGGNAGANPTNGAFLGTTDNLPMEIKVNGERALRLEPNPGYGAPNVIGGSMSNVVDAGVVGATIHGGGATYQVTCCVDSGNRVSGPFGTIGGGYRNTSGSVGFVGGGEGNVASGEHASVVGGYQNTAGGSYSTVVGGTINTASGENATVAGGVFNGASGEDSFAACGVFANADGKYSFAAGLHARAAHAGTFVWSDSTLCCSDFASTAANQFLIHARGGVGIGSAQPLGALEITRRCRHGWLK